MIRTYPCSAESLIDEIRSGIVYSYSRYGDGEFRSILGWRGNNANEHDWTPNLQKDLINALLSRPEYRLATVVRFVGMGYHKRPGDLDTYLEAWKWLETNGLDFIWYDQEVWADSLLSATKYGVVMPLLSFLREPSCPKVAIVGPFYLRYLQKLFPISAHIVTPDTNCHKVKWAIERLIVDQVSKTDSSVLCLISASMVAEVIIHDIHPQLGDNNWLIDVGSIWDPFIGRSSTRTYWAAMGNPVI